MLLLDGRYLKPLVETAGYEGVLPYDEGESGLEVGQVPSAVSPPEVDSEFVIWTGGPAGSLLAPAVAGIIAGRRRELSERLAITDRHEPNGETE